MQDEVNTKVVAIMIKGGKISAEVLKKALDKFVQEIEKAQKQMQQPKTCLLYTSPSPRDPKTSRMPSSA